MPDGVCLCRCKLCLCPVPLPGSSQYGPQVASETTMCPLEANLMCLLRYFTVRFYAINVCLATTVKENI